MSVRWMAVQYLGDTLRLPIVNQSDLHKPFGTSVLERDIRRIVVNPYSESPVTFVPENENEKLQNRLELLLTILRNDCDISVSWDGLRGFWNVELTEDGCLMRDRACKAEAENANLRELVRDMDMCISNGAGLDCLSCPLKDNDGCDYEMRMRKLGIEAD